MIIIIDKDITVNELEDGSCIVTRPTMFGKLASHIIKSEYTAMQIASYLHRKFYGKVDIVQNEFPLLSDEDREFLLSGITPSAWAAMFPKEDVE